MGDDCQASFPVKWGIGSRDVQGGEADNPPPVIMHAHHHLSEGLCDHRGSGALVPAPKSLYRSLESLWFVLPGAGDTSPSCSGVKGQQPSHFGH